MTAAEQRKLFNTIIADPRVLLAIHDAFEYVDIFGKQPNNAELMMLLRLRGVGTTPSK